MELEVEAGVLELDGRGEGVQLPISAHSRCPTDESTQLRIVPTGVVAVAVAVSGRNSMGLCAAVGVTAAIVVGNVANGIVSISVAVLSRTHGRCIGAGEAVEPIVAKVLHLTVVDSISNASHIAGIIITIAQVLHSDCSVAIGDLFLLQTQCAGFVAVAACSAIAACVQTQRGDLPTGLVGRTVKEVGVVQPRNDLTDLANAVEMVGNYLAQAATDDAPLLFKIWFFIQLQYMP